MNSMTFLVSTLFDLYIMVVLLRVWLQWARADFYNPFSQFVVKATQPVVAPLRRIIPSIGSLDLATVLFAYLLCVAKFFTLQLVGSGTLVFDSSYLLIGLVAVVKAAGGLLFWVLILRAILSWVSQGRSPIEYVMIQLTEPLVAPIRRVIPPLGGLDLSILFLFIVLQFLNFFIGDLLSPFFGNLWFVL
ncbi:YggT family protein [Grimontia hollisae]|uniref:YGGT family n=1 Tax=Grimontia hollisae TaxID=673 RepID=A0A377HJP2_GRIHO|nr:YggT family protein [Grimontia hollisae]STO56460.1 YGGT family [Grimontia hollisae]